MENNILNPSASIMDVVTQDVPQSQREKLQKLAEAKAQYSSDAAVGQLTPEQIAMMMPKKPKQLVRKHAKIGRNDLCPCGSGKKYKKCCLEKGTYEGYKIKGTSDED